MKIIKIFKLIFPVVLLSQAAAVFPWDYVNKNNKAIHSYLNKEYKEAEFLFRQANTDNPMVLQIKYNLADSLYQQGKYSESQAIYLDLLKVAGLDSTLKQKAIYNLGNVYYRTGQKNHPEIFWPNSVRQYKTALSINPDDKQAKENYDFVKNKLEKLNQQKQANNQKSSPKSGDKNNKQEQTTYSNTPQDPSQRKIFSVTKSEAEEILRDLKSEEEGMEKFIKRRQINNKNNAVNLQDRNFKDW